MLQTGQQDDQGDYAEEEEPCKLPSQPIPVCRRKPQQWYEHDKAHDDGPCQSKHAVVRAIVKRNQASRLSPFAAFCSGCVEEPDDFDDGRRVTEMPASIADVTSSVSSQHRKHRSQLHLIPAQL